MPLKYSPDALLFPQGGNHGTERETCGGPRRAAVSGDGDLVSGLSPARGGLFGHAGRPGGGADLPEQARLPGQKRQSDQGRLGQRLRPRRHPGRLRAGLPAPQRGHPAFRQHDGRAGQGGRGHLPRTVGALLDAGTQGQEGDMLLRHQGRRDERRRQLRRCRGRPRRQPDHQPQTRRPAGVPADDHPGGPRGEARKGRPR